jgi:hypothetical protein
MHGCVRTAQTTCLEIIAKSLFKEAKKTNDRLICLEPCTRSIARTIETCSASGIVLRRPQLHANAPLGEIAIEPLCEAFELSGPEEDEGRRDVVAALGFIGEKHPTLQTQIANQNVSWLNRHAKENKSSNSEIVCVLLDFKAHHAVDAIRTALELGCIDTSLCGKWDEIVAEIH